MIDAYRWSSGDEAMLRLAQNKDIQIILLPPLFEEANRIRHILVELMRALAERGIGTILPDLPGMGESRVNLATTSLPDWRAALQACAAHVRRPNTKLLSASFRGAALFDDALQADAAWRLSPETGQRLVRDLMRTRLTSGNAVEETGFVSLAGNRMPKALVDDLSLAALPNLANLRTVRLMTEAAPADAKIEGSPIWRRSEPGDDPMLLQCLINELETWAKQCASS